MKTHRQQEVNGNEIADDAWHGFDNFSLTGCMIMCGTRKTAKMLFDWCRQLLHPQNSPLEIGYQRNE